MIGLEFRGSPFGNLKEKEAAAEEYSALHSLEVQQSLRNRKLGSVLAPGIGESGGWARRS